MDSMVFCVYLGLGGGFKVLSLLSHILFTARML